MDEHRLTFGKSRHNDLQWHFGGGLEKTKAILMTHVMSGRVLDKVFTKPLPISLFKRDRIGLMTPRDGK